jgi:two-component system, NtrC family, response regulator AlgB
MMSTMGCVRVIDSSLGCAPNMRILIVDDEPNIRKTLRVALESMRHEVDEVAGAADAARAVDRRRYDVALVDLRLGTASGLDVLEAILHRWPRTAVVIITAHGAIDTAVEAMRRGAFDYLPKPFTPGQIRAVLERLGRLTELQSRVDDLEEQLAVEVPEISMDSEDPQMRAILEQGRRVADTGAVVLIRGESGTGKGILARAIHAWSRRSHSPFVTVSCPSLSAELLESAMFGHIRGAFTGAVAEAEGKVAAAEGGTLFLDEIGDLPMPLQPKLLRFLQERRYERVGEARPRTADVRLVAATNRDLEAAVAVGQFREDLLFRLNVVELTMPPLRGRSDRLALAVHLLAFFARQMGKAIEGFTPEAREALLRYTWPGNLRELRNAMERAAIFAAGPAVDAADLPGRILAGAANPEAVGSGAVAVGEPVTLDRLEAEHIRLIVARTPSREDAACILGIDPSTLYRKRKQLGL